MFENLSERLERSFKILKGEGKITDNEGNEVSIMAGDTLLIPATTETLSVSGTIKFLETYI